MIKIYWEFYNYWYSEEDCLDKDLYSWNNNHWVWSFFSFVTSLSHSSEIECVCMLPVWQSGGCKVQKNKTIFALP